MLLFMKFNVVLLCLIYNFMNSLTIFIKVLYYYCFHFFYHISNNQHHRWDCFCCNVLPLPSTNSALFLVIKLITSVAHLLAEREVIKKEVTCFVKVEIFFALLSLQKHCFNFQASIYFFFIWNLCTLICAEK